MPDFISLRGKRLAVPEDEFFEWHGATACYFKVDWAQPDSCDDPTEWRILHDDFCDDAHGKALIKLAASRAVVVWERKASEFQRKHKLHTIDARDWDEDDALFMEWIHLIGYAEEWRELT